MMSSMLLLRMLVMVVVDDGATGCGYGVDECGVGSVVVGDGDGDVSVGIVVDGAVGVIGCVGGVRIDVGGGVDCVTCCCVYDIGYVGGDGVCVDGGVVIGSGGDVNDGGAGVGGGGVGVSNVSDSVTVYVVACGDVVRCGVDVGGGVVRVVVVVLACVGIGCVDGGRWWWWMCAWCWLCVWCLWW